MRKLATLALAALALSACGGSPSPAETECAALHQQNKGIGAELAYSEGETVEETLNRSDRLIALGDRMAELGCGPARDYE
jgi:hypothetical protein